MSDSLFGKRRQCQATVLLVVASLVLVLVSTTCCANSAREVQPTEENNKDLYAYLDMLDEVDLQQMIYEKTQGQVQVSAFRNKKELVAAVRKIEEHEDVEASFNERVMAAMQRKASLAQQSGSSDASSGKAGYRASSSSSRHHRGADESNNIKNSNKQSTRKVVQLTDGDDDVKAQGGPSHSQEKVRAAEGSAAGGGGGAEYAGAKKASPTQRISAIHKLEVLYCTG